jgi:hypothetical protein
MATYDLFYHKIAEMVCAFSKDGMKIRGSKFASFVNKFF